MMAGDMQSAAEAALLDRFGTWPTRAAVAATVLSTARPEQQQLETRYRRLETEAGELWDALGRCRVQLQLSIACGFCGAPAWHNCTVRASAPPRRAVATHSYRTSWAHEVIWPAVTADE